QIAQRKAKLAALRERGVAFPNDFRRDSLAADLHHDYDHWDKEALAEKGVRVRVAGRMITRRIMGKASFATIQDMSGQIQLYVARDNLPEGVYNDEFKKWDLGDKIGRASCRERVQMQEGERAVQGIRDFHVTGVQTCALPI